MFRRILVAVSLIIAISIVAQITNYESSGNLKSDTKVPPAEIKDITNSQNPVDIFNLAKKKIKEKKYDEAAMAYTIAYAYGMYDTYRVEDKSAHQALPVLVERTLGKFSKGQIEKLQQAIKLLMQDRQKVLDVLNKLGKPTYYPKYMIQHGMASFTGNGSKDGLVANFDSNAAWKETLSRIFPEEEGAKQ